MCMYEEAKALPSREIRNPHCPTITLSSQACTHSLYRSRPHPPCARWPGHAWRVSSRLRRRQGIGDGRSAAVSANNM